MGKSGSGKSTLLRLLKKEIAPVGKIGGEININCDSIGFVGQNPETSFVCDNVRSELAFALENEKYSNDEITVRIGETASFFNLNFLLDKKIDELSGGEKQRVAIARALVNDPKLIIADEPTGNIDPELSYEIVELLKGINDCGTTILMVTHEHDLVRYFGGRIININKGQIAFDEVIGGSNESK